MLTIEERLALNSDQQTSVRLQLKGYKDILQDLETEREVLLEEQQAQAEYASVRGISAPDF